METLSEFISSFVDRCAGNAMHKVIWTGKTAETQESLCLIFRDWYGIISSCDILNPCSRRGGGQRPEGGNFNEQVRISRCC